MPVRQATLKDLTAIREIYNQGIEDRIATLESTPPLTPIPTAVLMPGLPNCLSTLGTMTGAEG